MKQVMDCARKQQRPRPSRSSVPGSSGAWELAPAQPSPGSCPHMVVDTCPQHPHNGLAPAGPCSRSGETPAVP